MYILPVVSLKLRISRLYVQGCILYKVVFEFLTLGIGFTFCKSKKRVTISLGVSLRHLFFNSLIASPLGAVLFLSLLSFFIYCAVPKDFYLYSVARDIYIHVRFVKI